MVRRRWWVIGTWIIVLAVLGTMAKAETNVFRDVFTVPNTNSQAATDLLAQRFPAQQDPTATIVVSVDTGTLTTPQRTAAITKAIAAVAKLPGVAGVTDPLSGPTKRVSADGRIAVATVRYTGPISAVPKNAFTSLESTMATVKTTGMTADLGGQVVDIQNSQASSADISEAIGLLAAIMILLFVFGSIAAAFMPIGVAIFGVGMATAILTLLASKLTIGTVSPALGSMIGLGVGIDYSLLIVSRYLQNRSEGMDHEAGVGNAVGTAGMASLFAGCCVAMALAGLALAGIPYVRTLGLSAGLFVVVMVIAALTLLPAVLGVLGPRIEAHHRDVEAAEEAGGMWYRFAHLVADHAVLCLVSALVILSILASPLIDLKLGFADDGDAPTSLTQRRAYDLVTQGFGTGANGPLLVAMALPNPTPQNEAASLAAVEKLAGALGTAPNVASVTPPIPSPTDNAAIILVTPKSAPNAASTQALVKTLRSSTIPAATNGTVLADQVFVGGQTATLIDVDHRIGERLLLCIGAVILAAFLLLMMVFRSVLVPLTAAVLNMFSIGAAYGVIVVVFQWGWGRSLIGIDQPVPIVAFIPLMMFAILFGLSMDYEVFLLSRVREEYLRSGDSREAVAIGVAKTARVITAAALIMIAVFLSFVLSPEPTLKMMGIGMAAAVLVDATVVRLLLVPASMELLGNATWWLPKWLDRILPHLNVEGSPAHTAPAVKGSARMSVQGVGVESDRTEADSTTHDAVEV
ncbi:MAG: MMPL family transporter [Acidimicrobiia bacterium]|nr:MMPL family transporter [Acidimicrobiia bacterium]